MTDAEKIAMLIEALTPFAKDAEKAKMLSPHNTIAHVTTCRARDLRKAQKAIEAAR